MINNQSSAKIDPESIIMRWFCLMLLIVITLLEIGPMPISGLLLIYVVLFRPLWFYKLIVRIYRDK